MDTTYGEEMESRFYRLAAKRAKVLVSGSGYRAPAESERSALLDEIDVVLDNYNRWRSLQADLERL